MKIPNDKRGTLEVKGYIPCESILAIDEHGDCYFPHPHICAFRSEVLAIHNAYPKVVTYNPSRKSFYINDGNR